MNDDKVQEKMEGVIGNDNSFCFYKIHIVVGCTLCYDFLK